MSDMFDARFYANKYGVPRWLPGPVVKAHYRLLGSRRGYEPVPFFNPAFFARQVERRKLPPVSPRRSWNEYLTNPAYWSVDPHPSAFFPHETFASCSPTSNPLKQACDSPAIEATYGYGHPLLDAQWWLAQRGLPMNTTLDSVLRDVTAEATQAASDHRVIALSPALDVLFINGEDHCPACTQYRVWSPAQALRGAGLRVAVVDAQDIVDDRFRGVRLDARAVIIFRARVDGQLLGVVDAMRARGAAIGFDCDDLIFDRPHTVGLQPDEFGHRDTTSVNDNSRGMQAFLQLADFAVVPTETIARAVADAGVPLEQISVCPSFLSPAQLAAAPAPVTQRPMQTLSIASGTWTHQEDFRSLAGSLARVLSLNPDLTLKVFGALSVEQFPELVAVESQIDRDARVIRDWGQYLARYQESAINLVSMDYDNGFCHGKSEVKYIEASLAGIATAATGTEAFRRALQSPATQWLASSDAQWDAVLARFASSPDAVAAACQHAYDDVQERYGPDGEFAHLYVATVQAIIGQRERSSPLLPCRWTCDADQRTSVAAWPRLAAVARALGASRIKVHREPREPDLLVEINDSLEAVATVAWVDPRTFYPRITHAQPRTPKHLLFIAPPPSTAVSHAVLTRARVWRDIAQATGASIVVAGREASHLGVPRERFWLTGGSEVELATLLRSADIAVQLDADDLGEIVVGALMVGTPLAIADRAADEDGCVPPGWRLIVMPSHSPA